MAIFRPQIAASYCEMFAQEMVRLARFYPAGVSRQLFIAQQHTYERRRDQILAKYSIEYCALSPAQRGSHD